MNLLGQPIKFKPLATLFLVSYASIWGFIEAGIAFKMVSLPDDRRGALYFLGILAFSLLIALVIAWYTERTAKQVEIVGQVRIKLKRLQTRFNHMISDGSYFKLIYLDWRMQVELEKTQVAEAGRYILVAEDIGGYILSATDNILKRLGKNDEYVTLSNIDFWGHMQSDTKFFSSNVEVVTKQGVHIKRIVLVDKKSLDDPTQFDEFFRIKQMVKALHEEYQHHRQAFEPGKMEWYFYISDTYKPNQDISIPYAIITNKPSGECLAILPKKKDEKTKPRIEMYFSETSNDENISAYLTDFGRIAKSPALIDIPTFYHELQQGKWAR